MYVFFNFRAKLKLQTNSTLAQLEISPLMTADEDLYKCEVTYLEAKEHCALLQSIKLNTFGTYFLLVMCNIIFSSLSSSV